MDPKNAAQWIDLGRILLLVGDDHRASALRAERAFATALKLDESVQPRIDVVRAEVEAIRQTQREEAAEREAQRLKLLTPEAKDYPADPWPTLTRQAQADAAKAMREGAEAMLATRNIDWNAIDTGLVLFYSDLEPADAARWARMLHTLHTRLDEILYREGPEPNVYGRLVVIVSSDRDEFRLLESEAFAQLLPTWLNSVCHPVGAKVFVTAYREPDNAQFRHALVRSAVFAWMHRYRTPRRLPAWANEGFADFIASTATDESPVTEQLRRQAIDFVRAGGNVNTMLDWSYGDEHWPGPERIANAVGYLLIDMMARAEPKRFARWVAKIKDGDDWETALQEQYGTDRGTLVNTFIRFYRVNN
jgi:hypothetical protein